MSSIVRFGVNDPPPPGISDAAWQKLQELRHHVSAHDRFAYEPRPDGSRSFRCLGGVSPAMYGYQDVVSTMVESCLDVRRSLRAECPGIELPDAPVLSPELCDNTLGIDDKRRWLAYKSAIEKVNEWVGQTRARACQWAEEHIVATAKALPGQSEKGTGNPKSGKPAKRPGRKVESDPKEDRRIAEAWKGGQHESLAALARAFGIKDRDVKLALDRHRKRQAVSE